MYNIWSKLLLINQIKQEQNVNKQEQLDNKTCIAQGLAKKKYTRKYMQQYNRKKKEKEQKQKQNREQLLKDVENIYLHLINLNVHILPLEVQAEIKYIYSHTDIRIDELITNLNRIFKEYI